MWKAVFVIGMIKVHFCNFGIWTSCIYKGAVVTVRLKAMRENWECVNNGHMLAGKYTRETSFILYERNCPRFSAVVSSSGEHKLESNKFAKAVCEGTIYFLNVGGSDVGFSIEGNSASVFCLCAFFFPEKSPRTDLNPMDGELGTLAFWGVM